MYKKSYIQKNDIYKKGYCNFAGVGQRIVVAFFVRYTGCCFVRSCGYGVLPPLKKVGNIFSTG